MITDYINKCHVRGKCVQLKSILPFVTCFWTREVRIEIPVCYSERISENQRWKPAAIYPDNPSHNNSIVLQTTAV